jgi:hypothetical protein
VNPSSNSAHHVDDEVLADLTMRLLSGDEAQAALDHMATCRACEMRFQQIAGEWERSAALAGPVPDRTIESSKHHDTTATLSFKRFWRKPVGRWMIGTAAAVIAALMLIPMRMGGPGIPAPTKLPPLTRDVLPRSVLSTDQNDTLLRGLDAYARDDFASAVDALREVEATGPVDALRRVYLASALVHEGQCKEAIEILDGVPLDAVPDPWSAESKWTQYVALTECGRQADAEKVLRELSRHPGEPGERARAIIEHQR